MQLIRVVFPAPFPPISPTISPGRTSIVTSWRAWRPPKEMETPRVTSGSAPGSGPNGRSGRPRSIQASSRRRARSMTETIPPGMKSRITRRRAPDAIERLIRVFALVTR